MKRFKLIANPASGQGRTRRIVSRAAELLGRAGATYDIEFTAAPRHAAEIARKSCKDLDAIVAVGGDGTVHEVAGGMLSCGIPLGIIPAGTGNDFIKSLNIPNEIGSAVDVLLAGKTRVIDAGSINGLCFVNVVGIGFDAAVNRKSHDIRRPAGGLTRYLWALAKTLGTYDPVPLKISMNGATLDEKVFLLSIGNGTTCGGGFKLTPRARLDDGLLDVTLVKPIGVLPLLRHLPKVFNGTLDQAGRYASMTRTTAISVECSEGVPVHVDGEIYRGNTSVLEIGVMPGALTVIGRF